MKNENMVRILCNLPKEIVEEIDKLVSYVGIRFESRNQKIIMILIRGLRALVEEQKMEQKRIKMLAETEGFLKAKSEE